MAYPIKESSGYLRHILKNHDQDESIRLNPVRGVFLEWAKLELEKREEGIHDLNIPRISSSLDMIGSRIDCADFVMPSFLTMLCRYPNSVLLTEDLRKQFREMIIGFKYAMNDPNEDKNSVSYFTENHQALYAASEYIAGQLYPDELFLNNKRKGIWHRDRGEKRIRQWIEWRARFGFSEWLSSGYYGEDLLALALVYGLANNIDLQKQAGMLIELVLFDIAINSFNGSLNATSGRAYNSSIMRPELASVSPVSKMYWGEGSYEGVSLGAVALAVFEYTCSSVVKNVALDKSTIINRERMSINVEDSKKYGLDPKNYDDIMFYWGQVTLLHRDVIENSMKICPPWLDMRPAINAHWEKFQLTEKEGKACIPHMGCCALTQTDIYTYKTAYYSLSCSQDFRKGEAGFHQHIWQASLGDNAVVFTSCPGSKEYRDRPNYFMGNKFMPRAIVHENVLLCVYRTPSENTQFFFTHLYFPQREFDQIIEEDGWIFGKRGGAYIAVKPSISGKWQKPDIELYKVLFPGTYEKEFKVAKPWDLLVPGHAVVWICEMGDEKTNGSFYRFVSSFRTASFSGDTFAFAYSSPSAGEMSFGWNESLKIKGEEISVHNYKRYDNSYCQTEFGEKSYHIRYGGEELRLDFGKNACL